MDDKYKEIITLILNLIKLILLGIAIYALYNLFFNGTSDIF